VRFVTGLVGTLCIKIIHPLAGHKILHPPDGDKILHSLAVQKILHPTASRTASCRILIYLGLINNVLYVNNRFKCEE
jgi:hypothetical protein